VYTQADVAIVKTFGVRWEMKGLTDGMIESIDYFTFVLRTNHWFFADGQSQQYLRYDFVSAIDREHRNGLVAIESAFDFISV